MCPGAGDGYEAVAVPAGNCRLFTTAGPTAGVTPADNWALKFLVDSDGRRGAAR